ncbi:MAG: hypothetical protein WCN92_03475 [Eubacteriales bacterium]
MAIDYDFIKMKNREHRRNVIFATIVILLIIVLCLYFFPIPWNIDKNVSGIQYRNADTSGYYEKKAIHIKGTYKHYLVQNKSDLFEGNFIIDGYDTTKYVFLPIITPRSEYLFIYIYFRDPKNPSGDRIFGYITSKPFLKEFSINVEEPIGTNGNQSSGDKGLIIVAPASNRQEAITMKKSLNYPWNK